MFLGTYDYSIDSKGRLFLPAKLREGKASGGGQFIVTKGLESCLYLYDPEQFRTTVLARLKDLPVKNQQDARAFKRLLLSGAQDVTLDDLGRILIPKSLIEYSQLKKNVTILGVGERVELWSAPKWGAYNKKAGTAFQRLGKQFEI